MENEQILSALTQVLEEQKEQQAITQKIRSFLENMQAQLSALQTGPLKGDGNLRAAMDFDELCSEIGSVQKQISELPKNITQEIRFLLLPELNAKMLQLLCKQPRPVIRQWRFLLFPEQNAKEYYSTIFRLIMWMTLVCMGVYLFVLGKQALENAREVKLRQLEVNQYRNAWEYMYKNQSRQGKKKMEDAWQKSWEREY